MSNVDKEYYEYLMSQDKSDLAIEIMNRETSSSNNRIAESIKENDQLKQQLAEKEKELKHLKELKRFFNSLYGKTTMNRFQEIQRQDKISFTVKQLEKVKELLDSYKWYQGENEYSFIDDYAVDWSDIVKTFNNQIKQIKEML